MADNKSNADVAGDDSCSHDSEEVTEPTGSQAESFDAMELEVPAGRMLSPVAELECLFGAGALGIVATGQRMGCCKRCYDRH